jgi:DNA repair and recombination protein RAD52
MFSVEQKDHLSAPLSRAHIKTRSQAGRSLSYIEGWWAISEANRIFGFDGWHRETVDIVKLGEPREVDGKWRVSFMAKVRITVGAIVREGCGYGSGISKDLGDAYESALKESETDAMKRAFMTFGNPFGLALYDKEQNGVESDPKPSTQPAPAQSDTARKAKEWAQAALKNLQVFTPAEFETWHRKNRDSVARVAKYDADLHKKLVAEIGLKLDALNPIGV